jgi:adenylate kinase
MRATILAAIVLAFSVNQAFAVSREVRIACRADYFAHCSMHAVGSPGVRKCMRDVGPNLSRPCIGALIASGEAGGGKAITKKHYASSTAAKKHYANKTSAGKYASDRHLAKKKYAKSYSKKRVVEKPIKHKYAKYAARDD